MKASRTDGVLRVSSWVGLQHQMFSIHIQQQQKTSMNVKTMISPHTGQIRSSPAHQELQSIRDLRVSLSRQWLSEGC